MNGIQYPLQWVITHLLVSRFPGQNQVIQVVFLPFSLWYKKQKFNRTDFFFLSSFIFAPKKAHKNTIHALFEKIEIQLQKQLKKHSHTLVSF